MSNNTNTVPPVKDSSREEKMNQLLNQMAESFEKAFPREKELLKWVALSNHLIYSDRNAYDAGEASSFLFILGYNLIPGLLNAQTLDKKKSLIMKLFKGQYDNYDIYSRAIPFLAYKTIHQMLDATCDTIPTVTVLEQTNHLLNIAAIGNQYANLWYEKKNEM